NMQIEPLRLAGTCLITPKRFGDTRGYFTETYRTEIFAKHGLVTDWVQENQSLSQRGVLRGLHFQLPPHSETKLIRVVRGAILDVFVDLRKDFPDFLPVGCG
ncbi:MAG TPA: dTDP-4-dehydrorhamnose 3,5-epimerase family protein, partial [Methanothrix soehngenii]|nr:dTDP-4-dehydrorhamnose 3,5-epimerase family protein [Methanothrix soehngenii]